jgi:hypothetical protein
MTLDSDRAGFAGEAEPAEQRPDVIVYQSVSEDGQERLLDPAFERYDGRNAFPEYGELGLLIRLYHTGAYSNARLTGIIPPAFEENTKVTGHDFIHFIRENPDYDVYFINPFPQTAYYSYNVWQHGEIWHPGLIDLTNYFFHEAGIDFEIEAMGRNCHRTLLYSNYWVGNEKFWHRFVAMNLRLLQGLARMPEFLRSQYLSSDPREPDPPRVLALIIERLFSTYLLIDPDIKPLAFPHRREDILRRAQRDRIEGPIVSAFVDVVDEIDARGFYTPQDLRMFGALARLRAQLRG